VTRIAGAVRGCRVLRVGGAELFSAMTVSAGSAGGVVVGMAIPATPRGWSRGQSHRLGVALGTAEGAVRLVSEVHRAAARGTVPDRDGDRELNGLPALLGGVTPGAVGLLRPLVMTDLAASRWLERQAAMLDSGSVTGDAGQAAMPQVGEGIGRGWRKIRPPRIRRPRIRRQRSVLFRGRPSGSSSNRRFQPTIVRFARAQRTGGVERKRRSKPELPETTGDLGVAGHTVAGIQPRSVRLMAGKTLGSHPAVRGADMKRRTLPVAMALGVRAGLSRSLGSFLGVRIVAGATDPVVRIPGRVETGQDLLHLVTRQALLVPGPQGAGCRVAGSQPRHLGGELVTLVAMQRRLLRHLAEADLELLVAARLAAGLLGGDEGVDRNAMAGDALDLGERR